MKRLVLGLLILSLALAGGLSLLASESPDGLEHSMEEHSVGAGQSHLDAPMPDYEAPLALPATWRRAIAGLAGTLCVFGLILVLGVLLRGGKRRRVAPPHG